VLWLLLKLEEVEEDSSSRHSISQLLIAQREVFLTYQLG
jgi:hypothetical protein